MKKLLDCLCICLHNHIPFAAYRLPDKKEVSLVFSLNQNEEYKPQNNGKGFIMHYCPK